MLGDLPRPIQAKMKMSPGTRTALALALAAWASVSNHPAAAAVQPSLLFSDNMVLVSSSTQSATVFGLASPGACRLMCV